MAYLDLPSYESAIGYMKGEPNLQVSSGSAGAAGQATNQASMAKPRSTTPIVSQATGTTQGVLAPIKQGLETQTGDIQKAWQTFQEQVGPSRTFETIGGKETLQKAIQAPTTQQDYAALTEQAKNLLASSYAGPTALDTQKVADITSSGKELEAKAQTLQTGAGLETLIGQQNPTLTAGAKRYEAQQVALSPEYKAYKQQALTDVGEMWKQLSTTETQATKKAEERATEEKAIGEAGKEYLTGERGSLVDQWNKDVAAKEAQEAATQKAYNDLMTAEKVPDVSVLQNITPEMREGTWTAEQFNTPARQNLATAQQTYADIMAQYPELAQQALLNLASTKRGKEIYQRPENVTDEVYNQLIARQQALETAGFSPGTQRTADYGQYATAMPLYYAEGGPQNAQWQPSDYRYYLQLLPGGSPTRENMSTDQQKLVYNNIQDLLGEVDRISEEGEPFKAAKIAANVEQFLADEEAELEARKDSLTEAGEDWKKQLYKINRAYRRAKKANAWGKIVRIITGVASLGATEMTRQIPGKAGEIGTKGLTYGTLAGLAGAVTPAIAPTGMTPEIAYGILKDYDKAQDLVRGIKKAGE